MQGRNYQSPLICARNILYNNGVKGFYRGVSSQLIAVPIRNSFNITLYSYLKSQQTWQNCFLKGFIPGCLTGSVLSVIQCPVEIIKCNMQVKKEFRSSLECAKMLYLKHGLSFMSRGYLATLFRDSLGVGMFFGVYESAKDFIFQWSGQLKWWGWITCGAFSGIACWLAVLPLDCVKTKYQLSVTKESYLDVSRLILRERGVRGLWTGGLPAVLRTCLSSGVSFYMYELVRNALD